MEFVKLKIFSLLVLFGVVYLGVSTCQAQNSHGITFIKAKDWPEVLSIAKLQRKNIFVDAYATWCGPCKTMDTQTYPDSALGVVINKNYISIKVQMDRTVADDDYLQSWYSTADQLKHSAKIEVLPTMLFFSSDGKLLFKAIGYRGPRGLSKIATYAIGQKAVETFNSQLADYKNGKKDYYNLPDLISTVREILGDRELALEMAKDYKNNYLDKLPVDQQLTIEHIKFIGENGADELLNGKDEFFAASYRHPKLIDTILGNGSARYLVESIIDREEILPRIYLQNQPITLKPNWKRISTSVKKKYMEFAIEDHLKVIKMGFYRKVENWDNYTKIKSAIIEENKAKKIQIDPFTDLNAPAWDVFMNCNNKQSLNRALEWSELSMKLEMPHPNVQFYDTYANLLHKLGRTQEAIKVQETVVDILYKKKLETGIQSFPEYQDNLKKMQQNIPTWPIK